MRFRWPKQISDCLAIEHFELHPAQTLLVQGPSGCGKSTLLSLIAGLLLASQGRICLMGHDWRQLSSSRRDRLRADQLGYIFQQFNLLPYLSALDNVALACRFGSRAVRQTQQIRHQAQTLLTQMGLDQDIADRPASRLSVGQQQRVAAARALIGRPSLVIADEPTSALDAKLAISFIQQLRSICRDHGSALLLVSHQVELAAHFDRHIDLTALNQRQAG